ncbi:hypothetical protein H180DRAFT_05510 [Streptomyces sp. WMMB 322]|nr:hypothetical protein H180DRAFT_05510 [Streptomyces sp. WMMB 322]
MPRARRTPRGAPRTGLARDFPYSIAVHARDIPDAIALHAQDFEYAMAGRSPGPALRGDSSP